MSHETEPIPAEASPGRSPVAPERSPVPPVVRHILVGVDGSEHAEAAVGWAFALATMHGADVTVVCAFDTPWSFHRSAAIIVDGPPEDHDEAHATQIAGEAAARLSEAGVQAHAVAFEGSFAEAVLSVSHRQRPDLVIIGYGEPKAPRSVLLGSTDERVVRSCPVPVLLVH
jgi:nucleotide-binding universal stress UspA family protein